jgi:hypothetical protein
MGLIRRFGAPPLRGVNNRSCTVVFLSTKTALEEPITAAEGFHMGLD